MSESAAAAARQTPEVWEDLVVRLDPETKCVLHVYGNGTRLVHLAFSPDGARLAAVRLPELTPQQAAISEATALLVGGFYENPACWGYEENGSDGLDLQPGEADEAEEQLNSSEGLAILRSAPLGEVEVDVYERTDIDSECQKAWTAPVGPPSLFSRFSTRVKVSAGRRGFLDERESAASRPVWLENGARLVVPINTAGRAVILDGDSGTVVRTLGALDVGPFTFDKLDTVLYAAHLDGTELIAVGDVAEEVEVWGDSIWANALGLIRRSHNKSVDSDTLLWSHHLEERSNGYLLDGGEHQEWRLSAIDSARGPDGVSRLLLACGRGGVLDMDTMKLDTKVDDFTYYDGEETIGAMRFSPDGRYAVSMYRKVDVIDGTSIDAPNGCYFPGRLPVASLAISPNNGQFAFSAFPKNNHDGVVPLPDSYYLRVGPL
jgi:hypothetical protein